MAARNRRGKVARNHHNKSSLTGYNALQLCQVPDVPATKSNVCNACNLPCCRTETYPRVLTCGCNKVIYIHPGCMKYVTRTCSACDQRYRRPTMPIVPRTMSTYTETKEFWHRECERLVADKSSRVFAQIKHLVCKYEVEIRAWIKTLKTTHFDSKEAKFVETFLNKFLA